MPEDDNRPATKQDRNDLRDEFRAQIDKLRDDLIEQMRDMQTRAAPIEIRRLERGELVRSARSH